MEQSKHDTIMTLLEEQARSVGSEVRLDALESGVQVLSFLTPMYDDGSGLVLFQLCLIAEQGEYELAQLLAILQPALGDSLPHMEQAVGRWNHGSMLGSYGIYYGGDQLYHKYRLMLSPQEEPAAIVERIMDALALTYDEIARRYEAATAIATGQLTFQQALEQGLC